ncbi:MAG TPA: ABC transporter permease [Terriglobia bacterium]|nr:ABC transporter permease [Terriglobia bacterium]
MRQLRAWFQRLRALPISEQSERDLSAELESHLQMHIEDNLRAGMSADEARRQALLKLGGVEQVKEHYRERRGIPLLETLFQDLRYALRMLRRSPGFTAVAVLSLALGIGVNALVFSVINALLLRPLPVERPGQLVFLENKSFNSQSFPNYRDLRDRNTTFSGLVGYRIAPMELESTGGATRIWGLLATGNYFDVLGVHPVMGRFFHPADDLRPRESPYAVLSYNAWRGRFGGDPAIVGKTVRINRLPYTVLGVAPPDFHGTELWYWPELWVPMMMEPQIENYTGTGWLDNRSTWDTWVLGRLKPGVSGAKALANLNTIAAELAREHPENNEGLQFKLAKPGLAGDYIGGPARAFTLGVLGLAALVLLAACANLASLLTARAADRQREIAIRLSIGAKRSRVVRQVLTETLVLSLAGGAVGYGLAFLLSEALTRWRAPMDFPVQFDVNPDWRVFLFALAVSIAAASLFGAAPAWRASRTDANAVLKGGGASWGRSRLAFRDLLVVLQVALCFVLVAACLISLRGLQQTLKMRLGFEPEDVSVVGFDLGLAGYSDEKSRALQQRVLETVEQLPGVLSAAYSNSVPLSIDQSNTTVYPPDKAGPRCSDGISATYYQVAPGFFATMGTRLLAGRDFTWHDDDNSPRLAIVNAAFGRQVLHSENAVGKHFRNGLSGPLVEIIGVVEDGKYESLTEFQAPALFWPILQNHNSTTTLEVRSSLPAAQMVREMRQAVAELDPQLPLYGTGSLNQMLGFAFFPTQAAAIALSAFGVLAIMLAVTGIHGLVSYAVARRVREIGIRVAVGARPSQVLRLVLGRIMTLIAVGSAIGLVLALATGQVLASVVYGASSRDPKTLAAVVATIALLGLVSSWAPTRRALRIDPVRALRCE